MNRIAQMPARERADLFAETAERKALPEAIIEKDFWVCWVVHWAKSYLSKAQLVEITRRGYFRITTRGQTVLQSPPQKIDNKYLMQFEEFRQFRERSSATPEPDGAAPAWHNQACALVTVRLQV